MHQINKAFVHKLKAKEQQADKDAHPTISAERVARLKPGQYADGLPLDDVHYLCYKLVLRPNHFRSRKSLFDFADVLQEPAKRNGITFSVGMYKHDPVQIREILFIDTADFRLYNNAFILRRRIRYEEGFPVGDPEIVFKFRHPDKQKAAETDVRPQIPGDHEVKFKCQVLPLKAQLGGTRLLYSHNVQFPRSNASQNVDLSMETMTQIFPALAHIKKDPKEKLALVADTIIEEVLQDIGTLDFGGGIKAKTNVALWRTRGEHRPLVGEFSFRIKFKERTELSPAFLKRAEAFFVGLQHAGKDWLALDATKTGIVYRLRGNAPTSHE
jgi:hypothetical protein